MNEKMIWVPLALGAGVWFTTYVMTVGQPFQRRARPVKSKDAAGCAWVATALAMIAFLVIAAKESLGL